MKVVIALSCLIAVCLAAPADVAIVSQEASIEPDGKFHFSYETGDGVKAEEHGELKEFEKDHVAAVVAGRYSFPGDDGNTYSVSYTADEYGFHPEGAHLPVAPPVPEYIAKALAYIASHTPQERV